MAVAYTKEFLVEAYASRFLPLGQQVYEDMWALGNRHYDKVGKDKFRVAASLTPEALKLYKSKNCV